MGGLTRAVHWWEESQLRVLVLSSMAVQVLLLILSSLRRLAIPGWFRSITWLAYLAGDAVAIYALATLFNRHKTDEHGRGGGNSSTLEVVWAPVLLLHLGGHDGITAYNIEDKELWTRHLLTAVSQITVAIYVFCKSWPPGGDKKLLKAAILLFVPGVLKCLAKPWALRMASIHNLVSSSPAAVKQNEGEMYPLEEYVKRGKAFVEDFAQEQKDEGEVQGARTIHKLLVNYWRHHQRSMEEYGRMTRQEQRRKDLEQRKRVEEQGAVSKLFVDLSSSYPLRLSILKRLWRLSDERAYGSVREGLASAFLLLYTRLKTSGFPILAFYVPEKRYEPNLRSLLIRMSRMVLPWAAIGLFHHSHREAYSATDVNITYALFCCTSVIEVYSLIPIAIVWLDDCDDDSHEPIIRLRERWPEMVAQYSLIQFFVRNKRHSRKMWIARKLGCKDFLDQHWCMESCFSSAIITKLVLGYLKDGWKEKIQDAARYLRFNDHSSHWVLEHNHCSSQVPGMASIKGPFDESVLLWHMATDFCFFLSSISEHRCALAEGPTILTCLRSELIMIDEATRREMIARRARSSGCRQELTKCKAVQCRHMSNYMMYLLFVNPEMLLPGTRRNLFTAAYDELKDILLLEDNKPNLFATAYAQLKGILLEDNKWNGYRRVTAAFKEMKDILRDNKRNPLSWSQWKAAPVKEECLMERLISTMLDKSKQASEEDLKEEGRIEEPSKGGYNKEESFIGNAWILAQRLLDMGEEMMWEEIQSVWVEMLCFSASRCRGYLHAKALGKGGEFLSYVWILLFHMGMETFTDKLQRQEHTSSGGNNGTAPPSAPEISADPSPSSTSEVSTGTTLSPFKVHNDVAQSTSEIHMAAQDMV